MIERANFSILLLTLPLLWLCLWTASHAEWWLALPAAWCFAMVNMVPFSLLHEAVHGAGSPSPFRNRLLGVVGGMAFGTSFLMQKVAHLGHHRRNRTDAEMYDYYLPHESRALRNLWLYAGNLFGLYWFCIPFSNAVYLLVPWAYRSRLFVERVAPAMGFGPYVREIAELPVNMVWSEIALTALYHVGLWWLLDLSWQGWLLCYWPFALHWSALQYVDHAWSPRDVVNGAWNLKVSKPARWLALNYHYHLAHHQHPNEPWTRLPALVDADAPQPTFWRIYASLWKGVRPAPPMGAPADL